MSVLIVEGSRDVRQLLRNRLRDQGVEVTVADSVDSAITALERQLFSVVIIDLALPDGSGLLVLDELCTGGSDAHVIIVSESTAEHARADALARGADDFVVKPFLLRELSARVLAVRRRRDPRRDALLTVGPLSIDLEARAVSLDGASVELTTSEFDVLAYLAARAGHSFGRDQLLRAVCHSQAQWPQLSTVAEHIRALRSKIERDPARPQLIQTVRGTGYRLDAGTGPADVAGSQLLPTAGTLIHI